MACVNGWVKIALSSLVLSLVICIGWPPKSTAAASRDISEIRHDKDDVAPFMVFDNLYYVGDKWVSSYVIKTSDGLILVDALEAPYGKRIPQKLEYLGLDPSMLKYVVVTHGHSDHVGGAKYLQELIGVKVLMSTEDFKLAKIKADESTGRFKFSTPTIDTYVDEDTTLILGDTSLKLYMTPGHTRGSISIDFLVRNGDTIHRAFIVGGMGINSSDEQHLQQYLQSIERIRSLSAAGIPVEVNLSNHPHMNQLFKRKEMMDGHDEGHPFVDAESFARLIDLLEARARLAMTAFD